MVNFHLSQGLFLIPIVKETSAKELIVEEFWRFWLGELPGNPCGRKVQIGGGMCLQSSDFGVLDAAFLVACQNSQGQLGRGFLGLWKYLQFGIYRQLSFPLKFLRSCWPLQPIVTRWNTCSFCSRISNRSTAMDYPCLCSEK